MLRGSQPPNPLTDNRLREDIVKNCGTRRPRTPRHRRGRHQHQLLGERVGQRIGQQGAQPVGQQVSAFGTVEMKRRRGPP